MAKPIAHIFRDAAGVAWIDRTRVTVIEVALDHVAYGWSAEEIHRQHPHLSLAQTTIRRHSVPRWLKVWLRLINLAAGSTDSPLRRRLRLLKRPA